MNRVSAHIESVKKEVSLFAEAILFYYWIKSINRRQTRASEDIDSKAMFTKTKVPPTLLATLLLHRVNQPFILISLSFITMLMNLILSY